NCPMPGDEPRRGRVNWIRDNYVAVFCRLGGLGGGLPPDPIPNSAVKAPSAHGTASQDAGESVAAWPTKNGLKSDNPAITAKSPAREIVRGFLFVLMLSAD